VLQAPKVEPARSFEESLERIRAIQSRDDERIMPAARTALYAHGVRTPLAALLLHGFTNNPAQYREFAPQLQRCGVNVLVPRLPLQGDRNRMTRRLADLTAEQLLQAASEAVDAACGLGRRLCVAGISSSGLLCAYFAQRRADIARAIPISPVFSILRLPYALSTLAWRSALVLPNAFLWWDPGKKQEQRPLTAYPQFPTRALAQTMRIGEAAYAVRGNALRARSTVVVLNRHDPAVNNAVARHWAASTGAQLYEFADLPRVHDIIDPDNPHARTPRVYAALLELVLATP
jgi:alpha-beta hydrolase superfamily lysophospholipase